MGIYKFAKKMFNSNYKMNQRYIVSIAAIVIVIFNFINISYNEDIYSTGGEIINLTAPGPGLYSPQQVVPVSINLVIKENLFMLLIVTAVFAVFCNFSHIKRKGKELAFIISNGASIQDVSRYLLFTNGISYFIGAVIGLLLGIVTSPIFNFIMNKIGNIDNGKIFYLSFESILMAVLYTITQFVIIVILNVGYSYRTEIIDLIKVEKTITIHDKRNIKFPTIIFLIAYFSPVVVTMFVGNLEGGEAASYCVNYLGIIGIFGVVKYFIPKHINKIKDRAFMYKGHKRIYLCNALYSLNNNLIYLTGMTICYNFFLNNIVEYRNYPLLKAQGIFSIIGISFILGVSLVYSMVLESQEKSKLYNQLRILGYKKEEIVSIIRGEIAMLFTLALVMPTLCIICSLINYFITGVMTVSLVLRLAFIIIIPFILAGIVAYYANKDNILRYVYNNEKNSINGQAV